MGKWLLIGGAVAVAWYLLDKTYNQQLLAAIASCTTDNCPAEQAVVAKWAWFPKGPTISL